jgi:hypothetical protein
MKALTVDMSIYKRKHDANLNMKGNIILGCHVVL